MGFTALLGIIVVAILAGLAVQYLTKSSLRYEWLVVALAVAFGAYFASESFPNSGVFENVEEWGPVVDGMYIIPAVIGALILAVVADLGVRTGEGQVTTAT